MVTLPHLHHATIFQPCSRHKSAISGAKWLKCKNKIKSPHTFRSRAQGSREPGLETFDSWTSLQDFPNTHYNTSYRAFYTDYKSFKTLLSNNDYPCRGVPASPSVLDKKLITYRFPEKISRASKWEIAVFPFPIDIGGALKANVSFWGLNRLIVL